MGDEIITEDTKMCENFNNFCNFDASLAGYV